MASRRISGRVGGCRVSSSQPNPIWELQAELGEGPVWVERDQALWFTDIKKQQIHRYDPRNGSRRSWNSPEQVGFILPAEGGGFVAGLQSGLYRFDDRSGSFNLIVEVEPDIPTNRINDGVVDPAGRLWFGTMDNGERAKTGAFYCYAQGKLKRTSVTDALGRLTTVYEDPLGLNYQTSYAYDALDNLTTVTQQTQTRTFVYDSLKRLTSATNPESGTISYQYDAGDNLIQKTDARGIVSSYTYDALNRIITTDYSDTAINPDVKRFYDGATNGKGLFWYFYSGGDFSNGANVEHTAIDSYDALGRPLVKRQLTKLNGTWGPTYQTSRSYNLAGGGLIADLSLGPLG